MIDIDPLRDYIDPEVSTIRKIPHGNILVVAGIATIRGQTYAIPLIWNAEDDAYEVLSVSDLLQSDVHAAGLSLWSQIGVKLRNPNRDEVMYLLIAGVANLPHSPRLSNFTPPD